MADDTGTDDGVLEAGQAGAHGTGPTHQHVESPDGSYAGASSEAPAEGPEAIIAAEPQQQHRAEKLARRRERGEREPYRWDVDTTAQAIHEAHADLPEGADTNDQVSLAGRLKFVRRQGGLTFAVLQDRTGDVQLFVDKRTIGD